MEIVCDSLMDYNVASCRDKGGVILWNPPYGKG